MKWATKALLQIDRIASAWLILRFIDQDARFTFVNPGEPLDVDTTPFALPGAALSHGNGAPTTFQSLVKAYSIDDPAVILLARIVADVAGHAMLDKDARDLAARDPLTSGVLVMAEGAMLLSATDDECLQVSLPFYDVLYARLQTQVAIDGMEPPPPATILERCLLLARAADMLRGSQTRFSRVAIANAVRAASST